MALKVSTVCIIIYYMILYPTIIFNRESLLISRKIFLCNCAHLRWSIITFFSDLLVVLTAIN